MQQKISEWKDITQSWFLPRLLKQRKFCKELSLFSLQGRVNKEQVLPALQQLLFYQQQKQEVENLLEQAVRKGRSLGLSNQELTDTFELILEDLS